MIKLMFFGLLALSSTAFAQICHVDMVDRHHRVVRTFTARGDASTCIEGMKECRKSIRLDYSNNPRYPNGSLDCVRRGGYSPAPTPNPRPNPNPYPNPSPYPGSMDSRRMLNNGESAIFNNRYVTVIGANTHGLYAVRSTDGWNTVTNNVRRESLSVTNGCSMNICTSDSVINVNTARYEIVAGLSFDERFVTKSTDGWNTLVSSVERRNLAETKGCVSSRYAQICVGNTVINNQNRYSTVVGIQMDGMVVLRSTDGWNSISTRVDPSFLIVTR